MTGANAAHGVRVLPVPIRRRRPGLLPLSVIEAFLNGHQSALVMRMSTSAKDQIEGALHEVKGKVKETAGQVLNNPDLESEGQAENVGGKLQKKLGQIEKVFEK